MGGFHTLAIRYRTHERTQQRQGSGQQSQPANPPLQPQETAPPQKAAGASSPRRPAGSPTVQVAERSGARRSAELCHNKEYVHSECSAESISNTKQNNNKRGVAAARGELLRGSATTSNLPSAQSSRAGGSRRGGLPLTGAGSKFRFTAGAGGDSNSAAPTAATECEACQGSEGDARVDQELLQGFGITVCRKCKVGRLHKRTDRGLGVTLFNLYQTFMGTIEVNIMHLAEEGIGEWKEPHVLML